MHTSRVDSSSVIRQIPATKHDEPLDVLVITRSSLQQACSEALDTGDERHPLSMKMILCDRLDAATPEDMLDDIAAQIGKLRQKKMVTDHTRILINLPGNYENGKLLANARKNKVQLSVAELCSRIRKAESGGKPWAGTIHVACDGAGLARKAFVSHTGATILHSGKKQIGLAQRQQTLSLLAEAWKENKARGDQKLDAAAEFRLVARFSGESSSLVAGNKIAVTKPSAKWKSLDASERRQITALLSKDRVANSLALRLALARNHALAKLRHGSAEKFGKVLTDNPKLLEDELFLKEARKYALGLHIGRDALGKLRKLITKEVFNDVAGWKEALLLTACARGDTDVAELMVIWQGAYLNCRNTAGETPLHLAARAGDETIAALLLKHGADPKRASRGLFGKTPARIARGAGHTRVARLIDAAIMEDHLKKRHKLDGEIDLLFGGKNKKLIREYLSRPDNHLDHLDAYMMRDDRFAERSERGSTGQAKLARRRSLTLEIAATAGNPRLMKILIRAGVPVDKKISGGRTALHYAARVGDMAMVRLLLEQKADPELRSDAGSTAMDYAIRSGSPEVVELLLKHGARITSQHWFSRKTIEQFAAKDWLTRSELRSLVIARLAAYDKKFDDDRAIKVLANCLPPETKLHGEEADQLRAMIRNWPDSASARKLSRMLPKVSPDGSEELSTSSSDGEDAAHKSEQPSDH